MSSNDDFYKKFNSSSSKKRNFKSNVFVPFLSGILGASLVIGICFGIPSVRNKLKNVNLNSENNSINIQQSSNQGTVDYISLKNYSDTTTYAANKVLPSIVGIKVEYTITSNFLQKISQVGSAEGSGVIITSDGYILTNSHVINTSDSSIYYEMSEATKIYVYLYNDETPYEATIIGIDEKTDLAVIKIEKDDLTPAELGDSSSIKIGEFAMAVGNPLGMQSSVTSGIISAIDRDVDTEEGNTFSLIQTDAAINAGNSGGALVNSEGKVIGINTLKLSGTGIEGMGFAIPINSTLDIYESLVKYGKVLRPYIGIGGINIDEATSKYYDLPIGVYVKQIESNSPASSSDLKLGDIITQIDDKKITTISELNEYKDNRNIGDTVTLTISRNGETKKIEKTLGEQP